MIEYEIERGTPALKVEGDYQTFFEDEVRIELFDDYLMIARHGVTVVVRETSDRSSSMLNGEVRMRLGRISLIVDQKFAFAVVSGPTVHITARVTSTAVPPPAPGLPPPLPP